MRNKEREREKGKCLLNQKQKKIQKKTNPTLNIKSINPYGCLLGSLCVSICALLLCEDDDDDDDN